MSEASDFFDHIATYFTKRVEPKAEKILNAAEKGLVTLYGDLEPEAQDIAVAVIETAAGAFASGGLGAVVAAAKPMLIEKGIPLVDDAIATLARLVVTGIQGTSALPAPVKAV